MDVVRRQFRPEFINRVDDIILFHRLKRQHMGAIVDIQMARLEKLLSERNISVALSPEANTLLAERGYDPAYGARPLKRVILKSIQDPLAEEILSGRIKDGDSVTVTVKDGKLMFNGALLETERQKPVPQALTLH